MSARVQLGSILSCVVLLIVIGVVVITGSQANQEAAKQAANDSSEAKKQSIKNNEDIKSINKTLHHFVDMWTERIKVGNTNTNVTQLKIDRGVDNILNNLTTHRAITNQTNVITYNLTKEIEKQNDLIIKLVEDQTAILNATQALTSDSYNKAAEKKVENILGNMTAEHEIIFNALNISKSDVTTDAENDTENLGQLLKDFIKSQKDKPNEPQGPKVK